MRLPFIVKGYAPASGVDISSVSARTAMVFGAVSGTVDYPSGVNASGFAGFVHIVDEANNLIYLIVAGGAEAIASGTISRGAPLIIADSVGKVKAASLFTGDANIVGIALSDANDGDVLDVLIGRWVLLGDSGTLDDYLRRDGTKVMTGDLNINYHYLRKAKRVQVGAGGWWEAYLHVNISDVPGGVPSGAAACFENYGDTEIYILSKNTNQGRIYFGDDNSKAVGGIIYDHSLDELILKRGYSASLTIGSTIDVHSRRIENVSDPADDQDAATKKYVDGIKEVFYPAQGTGSIGDYAGITVNSGGGTGRVSGWFPANMASILEMKLVIIPIMSHDPNSLVIDVQYASQGEGYNLNTGGGTFVGATTANKITEIDISNYFGSATGGDYWGIKLTDNNSGLGGNDLLILGVRLKWI